jgi:hypothetical protein
VPEAVQQFDDFLRVCSGLGQLNKLFFRFLCETVSSRLVTDDFHKSGKIPSLPGGGDYPPAPVAINPENN